jgi:uncharacterized repeat protein (TIGR01451 family)
LIAPFPMKLVPAILALLFGATITSSTYAEKASGRLEGWQNKSLVWGTDVQLATGCYVEGRVVPLRFVGSFPAGTVHTVRIKYDFITGGVGHYFDCLRSFDATETGLSALIGISLPVGQQGVATWPIPLDSTLTPANRSYLQLPGRLTTYNISQLAFSSGYNLTSGAKDILLTFTVAGAVGSGNRTVVIAWGAHLAVESDWGSGGGACQFPGTFRNAYCVPDGNGCLNFYPNRDCVVPSADLQLNLAGPTAACVGSELTYQLTVKNLGPNTASNVVVTDVLAAETTFLRGSASVGTLSGTGHRQPERDRAPQPGGKRHGAELRLRHRANSGPGQGQQLGDGINLLGGSGPARVRVLPRRPRGEQRPGRVRGDRFVFGNGFGRL